MRPRLPTHAEITAIMEHFARENADNLKDPFDSMTEREQQEYLDRVASLLAGIDLDAHESTELIDVVELPYMNPNETR